MEGAASTVTVSAILSFLLSSAGAHGVAGVVFLIGVAVALIYYFLNRTLTLGFIEDSGVPGAIQLKRSVIENLDIDEKQAQTVCIIVQKLIEAKRKRLLQAGAA